jgi:predicted amidohydrolase YtcJ
MDKVENAYPVRSIMQSGANQSFGADWPASAYLSTYKPLELIEAAVTRRLPGELAMPVRNADQAVSIGEAIIAMTRNTAIQVGELDTLGSISVGKLADMVLLESNLFDIPADNIHSTTITMTVVNGDIVHGQ